MRSIRKLAPVVCAAGILLLAYGVGHLFYARFGTARGLTLFDYCALWFAPVILCAGIWLTLAPSRQRPRRINLRPVDETWSEARPRFPYRDQFVLVALMAIVYNATVVPASVHYLLADAAARGGVGVGLAIAMLVPGAALAVWAIRRGLVLRRVRDPQLLVNARTLYPGQEIQVRFVQQYLHSTHVERARVGLICTRGGGKDVGGSACAFEAWKDLPVELDVRGGKKLRVSGKFHLPSSVRPTSPPGESPRCDWRFVLRLKLSQGSEYQAEFPVGVSPTTRAMAHTDDFGQ